MSCDAPLPHCVAGSLGARFGGIDPGGVEGQECHQGVRQLGPAWPALV